MPKSHHFQRWTLYSSTPEERESSTKYPYRRVIDHTMVAILYALNALSRYGNNPGHRHILFLRHLLRDVKFSRNDRLMFRSHLCPWDMETNQPIMEPHFQCHTNLGGNRDNDHSQTSYLGYLANKLICGAPQTKVVYPLPQLCRKIKL